MQKSRIIETTVVAWRSIGQFEMIRFLYCEQLSLWINTEWMTSLRKRKQSIVLECALLYPMSKNIRRSGRASEKKKKKKNGQGCHKKDTNTVFISPVRPELGRSSFTLVRMFQAQSDFFQLHLRSHPSSKIALQPEFHSDLADCVLRATDWQPIVQQPGWCLGAFIFPLNTSLLQVVKRQPLDQCTRGTIYSSWSKCA